MKGNMILRISFDWVLIIFSYLIYSCVPTTAYNSKANWKRQPGTSTYSSTEHNIKVSFPNNSWKIYTGPEEGPPYVKKSWKKYKSKHETYHGLMAIHPDGGGIIMHLKIIPPEQLLFKEELEDLMASMRDVYEMRLQQQGGRLNSFSSKVIQRQNRRIAVAELQYYFQKDDTLFFAAIKEGDRYIVFEFNCVKDYYESKKSEFWKIIDSYERIKKDQYEQVISDTEKDSRGQKRDLTDTSSFSKGYEYIGTWKRKPETRTFTNFDHHIKLTFPNKRWLVYTRPQETPDLIKDIWKKSSKECCPGPLLVAVLLDKKIFMHLLILPNGPPFTKPVTLEQHIDYMTKYIGAGKSEYMVKSKISQLPGGSRVGIITFRLKDKQPASWLYAYLEEKDRFVWFTFESYKATPMNWNVSECWDIIRSYEYFGKPKYDQTVDTEPRNAEIYFDRGNNNAKIGQYDQAISDYDKAIELNPRYAFAYHNRGLAYIKGKGQYDKAITDFNKAIELNPRYAMAYGNRGRSYYNRGQIDKAFSDFNKAIEIDPMFADTYNERGNTYKTQGQYDKAISDYDKAIELNPGNAGFYMSRGNTYCSIDQYDKAFADYNKAIEINPRFGGAFYNRGNAYGKKGQYDRAISDFNKAIEINQKDFSAYHNRGSTYSKIGEYDKAISDYSKTIEINPIHANAYHNRGSCYAFGKRMYDKAILDFNKAIEINPKFAWAFNDRGYTYQLKGQYDEAISDCNKAIEINPMFYIAYNNRSFTYLRKGHYDKAISGFSEAIEINPKFAGAYANRAVAYFYKHEYGKAWDDVNKAQDLGSQIGSEFLQELREASGKESFPKQGQGKSKFGEKIVYTNYKIQFNELKNCEKLNPKFPNMIVFRNQKDRSQIVIRALSSEKTLYTTLEESANRWLTRIATKYGWRNIEKIADGNTVINGEESYWREYCFVGKGKKYNEKIYFVHTEKLFYVFRFYSSMHNEAFGNSIKEFDAWVTTIQFIR